MTDDILTTMELILNKVDVSLLSAFCLHMFIFLRILKPELLKLHISHYTEICEFVSYSCSESSQIPFVSYSAKLSLSLSSL